MNTKQNIPLWFSGLLLLVALINSTGCSEDSVTSPQITDKETHQETSVHDLDFAEVQRVAADTRNGVITLRGRESSSARLEIRKTVRASTLEEAQRISQSVQIDVQVIDGELVITSEYPEPAFGIDVRVDYELTCPATVEVDLAALNGKIDVNDMAGAVEASIANGRIEIAPAVDSRGALEAIAVNGVVTVDLPSNGHYDLSATAVSGCIVGEIGDTSVDQCGVGLPRVTMGEPDGIPCELRVTNGTIKINRK